MSKLDITIHYGAPTKPAILLIHGLGMDKNIWLNPYDSRILAGRFPITILLNEKPDSLRLEPDKNFNLSKLSIGKKPEELRTIYHDLKEEDFSIITWSQKRPSEPIDKVVAELEEIINETKGISKNGIIIVAHSRGGIIARKYLTKEDKNIRGLITLSCPHKGSSLANISKHLSPIFSFLKPFSSLLNKNDSKTTIKRLIDFLKSDALKELLQESPFFKSLQDVPHPWIKYISVGGTNPSLIKIYKYKIIKDSIGKFAAPEEFFSIPDGLKNIIPSNIFPEEWKHGKGDGLVTIESSRFPWDCEHTNFNVNHAEILFNQNVRRFIIDNIKKISNN